MRNIFEALDAEVDWDGTSQTITAKKDNTEIILQINNPLMYINGAEEKLDVAPIIVGDYTFVPIRAVSQSLSASVEWLDRTYGVYINSPALYEAESSWVEPEVIMYAPDGRTLNVLESEVEAYKNVGWYSSQAEAQAAYIASNSTSYNQSSYSYNQATSSYNQSETVYVGRTGNKYHYQNCRTLKGKGIPITMGEALAQGRTSCKVCKR